MLKQITNQNHKIEEAHFQTEKFEKNYFMIQIKNLKSLKIATKHKKM